MTPPQPPTDAQLAAYIGPSWEKRYRRKFERFRQDPRGGFKPSWNWRAAFFPAWFLLHRLYVPFAALLACFLIGLLLVGSLLGEGGHAGNILMVGLVAYVALYPAALVILLSLAVTHPTSVEAVALASAAVALTVVQGVIADWLLYRQALAAPVAEPPAAPRVRTGRLSTFLAPSVSPERVFIAAVALSALLFFLPPLGHHGHTRQDSYVAMMKSDLRNLVTAEESYFADHRTYTATLTRLPYSASAGNTVAITSASRTGWAATANNNGTTKTCAIYVGTATPPISGQNAEEPRCP